MLPPVCKKGRLATRIEEWDGLHLEKAAAASSAQPVRGARGRAPLVVSSSPQPGDPSSCRLVPLSLRPSKTYTDAAHIADGVIGLKQRSLAANDPTE